MIRNEVRKAVIKEGKERCQGELFLAEYSFADRAGRQVDLCLTYREPTGAELQAYSEMQARDAIEANRWLMKAVVLSTEGGRDILDIVGAHNIAVSTFLTEYINPLYGKVLEMRPIQSL